MIGALALVLIAVAGGTLATYVFDRDSPGYARPATGAFVGLTALGFVAFLLALAVGLGPVSLVGAAAVTAIPLLLLRSPAIRARVGEELRAGRDRIQGGLRQPTAGGIVTGLYGAAIAFGAWLVADRTFFANADGMHIGNVNNLGDLPYHVQITASFAYGNNFPPENPVFAGSGFSYHYVADFLASIFVAAGSSVIEAMLIMNVVLGIGLMTLIHRWTRDLTGSTVAARVAPLLLVFSGGFGFLNILEEARVTEQGLIATFLNSHERYTIAYEGALRFGNAVTALLIPQRALFLGMGLAVIVFTLLWRQLDVRPLAADADGTWRGWVRRILAEPRMLVAGILTGLLPIVHVHTFGVVLGTAFFVGLIFREWRERRWEAWTVYVVTTLVVALPVFGLTARGSEANVASFVGLDMGWELGVHDPITFWLTNTGLMIPLLIMALVWRWPEPILSPKLLLFALPFLAWFIVPNVVRLAPWMWDNIKVLIYWWLGAVPVVAYLLARMWREQLAAKAGAVVLAVALMLSGFMDVSRATIGPTYQEWDPEGIAFADEIRAATPERAVVLTAPTYNTPIFLTGRPVYMGYVGFLWANGLPYPEREPVVRAIYAGEPGALDLARDNGIAYVVLGPHERSEFSGVEPNEPFLSQLPVAVQVGAYTLFEIPAR